MNNTLDDVQQTLVSALTTIAKEETVSMDEVVKNVTRAASNKMQWSLITPNESIKNFDQWLEATGFHNKIWKIEYEQALKVLFHSK